MASDSHARSRRHVRTEVVGETLVVRFVDSKLVTEEIIQEAGDQLYDLVETCVQASVLLHFGNVQYLSSAALGKLINTRRKCGERNLSLCLCCIEPELYEVFVLKRMNQIFLITRDENEAMELLTGHSEIACPVHGCDGLARSTVVLANTVAKVQYSRCFAIFSVVFGEPDAAGNFVGQVRCVRLPTYEHGHIEFHLSYGARIEVVGPLDLFAAEQLQRVWLTLPPPRSVAMDLRKTTELSQLGLEALVALSPREGKESSFEVVLGESLGEWVLRFPAGFPVKVVPPSASWSRPWGSQVRVSVKGQCIGTRFRGPPGRDSRIVQSRVTSS
jgi:anti-sigma B factor antagonist